VSNSNQFSLLTERRFAPFFATQFLGAFNDNVFRNGLIIVITFQGIKVFGLDPGQLANIAGALFMLPYFLFSANAGQLADKYEKSRLMRSVKIIEICLMTLAVFAFIKHMYAVLFLVLFLMGCQSTLFGPVKYAYLPQKLATDELIGGNALVESGTYIAIIFGLIVGGLSVAIDPTNQYVLSACLLSIAVLGYLSSRAIPNTPAVAPELVLGWNSWKETQRIVGFAKADRRIFISILGISWFWFFGSAMTLQVPAYTLTILNGNEEVTTVLLVAFAIGIGIGSLLCERLSGRRIEIGLVPLGSLGITLFTIDLWLAQPTIHPTAVSTTAEFVTRPGSIRILLDIILIGAFAGIYSVPLYALVQANAAREHLSRVIAANNIFNSLFVVSAAMIALILLAINMSVPQMFLTFGILNAVFAICIYSAMPTFLVQFQKWLKRPFND